MREMTKDLIPVLDERQVADLVGLDRGKGALFSGFVSAFTAGAAARIAVLRQQANGAECAALADSAHALRGAAGNVGDILVYDQITGGAENELAISAGGSIGNIESIAGGIEGLFQAAGSIGDVTAAGNILAPMLARAGSIGAITSRAGFLESVSIQAGADIGPLSLYAGMLGTSVVAGRDLGPIDIRVGGTFGPATSGPSRSSTAACKTSRSWPPATWAPSPPSAASATSASKT